MPHQNNFHMFFIIHPPFIRGRVARSDEVFHPPDLVCLNLERTYQSVKYFHARVFCGNALSITI